jgi:hypothetical protein
LSLLRQLRLVGIAILSALPPQTARAIDQIYDGDIARPGQFIINQYADYGRRALNGAPEVAYGVTGWWELGAYLPFTVQDRQLNFDEVRLRSMFISPDDGKRGFFYGVVFSTGYSPGNSTPVFSQQRFDFTTRPIIGFNLSNYEFILNPTFNIGFDRRPEVDFAPSVRAARKIARDLYVGLEYYVDGIGKFGDLARLENLQHTLFAVVDFKAGVFDVSLGAGYSFASKTDSFVANNSDGFVVKAILSYPIPTPTNSTSASGRSDSQVPSYAFPTKNSVASPTKNTAAGERIDNTQASRHDDDDDDDEK